MSSPPSNYPHYEGDSICPSPHDAELWSLLQEIDISLPADDHTHLDRTDPIPFELENPAMISKESLATVQSSKEKGSNIGDKTSMKNSKRNRRIKHLQAKKTLLEHSSDQPSSSVLLIKKENHNAKERVRRMQLNASYLALRSLLPADARRSKVYYYS